jgi:transcriptional regulator with XRE-family HTH domain
MTNRLPPHTLMVTFLHDRLKKRGLSLQDLVELLDPIPEKRIQDWFKGHAAPEPTELMPLAEALQVSPVELTCGWLIDQAPHLESLVRQLALDRMPSRFPRSDADDLRAPSPRPSLDVEDPFDARVPGTPIAPSEHGPVRKAAPGSGKPVEP